MSDLQTQQLYEEMERVHIQPLWRAERSVNPFSPEPKAIPWLWKGSELLRLARRSGELVPIERGGDRRALGLSNPGLGGAPFATPTLWAAIQWLNGHECAPAHRHSAQAIRFVLESHGTYSTVQGDRVYLERGDFVINPPWYWHDHGSDDDRPAYWLDALDVPLTNYLDAPFFEASSRDAQEVTKVLDGSVLKYGAGSLRPAWEPPRNNYSPISTYKWRATDRALTDLAKVDASPFDDVALEYTNPHTGKPVMDTMTAWVQMLRSGVHTKAHRQVNSSVYLVFEGRGATIINGVRFAWEQGDVFVLPSWVWHEHLNESRTDRAVLFSVQDTPVMTALGKYREEALPAGHQLETGSFDPRKDALQSAK